VPARRLTRLALTALTCLAVQARADWDESLHATPSLYFESGDHRIDLGIQVRTREELWDAYQRNFEAYVGTRSRLRFQYTFQNRFVFFAQVQDVRLASMDPVVTGPPANYRIAADGKSHVGGTDLRQLGVEFRPTESSFVRVGRQDVKLGSEISYAEPDWRFLKNLRLGERLIGSVGFSHSERAGDGLTAGWDTASHNFSLFAAQATTGVFEVDDAYEPLERVRYEGGAWTVKRGTWVPNTELEFFALGYHDDRGTHHGGTPAGIGIATFGGSWLGIYEVGLGKVDVTLWGAGQVGHYNKLDHGAWAGVAEVGYQLPVFATPWLRGGINYASGDENPNDGAHHTFANLLPTNHIYYGFADQLAFQNLLNPFVQLRLTPHPMVTLSGWVHWFRLARDDDARYAGTGAYSFKNLGFSAQPSRGFSHVGREYDLVLNLAPHRAVTFELGWSWFEGGALFQTLGGRNLEFGYASVELRY
jgi:hypothetical protein